MDVFDLRDKVVGDYGAYIRSFLEIRDPRIRDFVQEEFARGYLWPQPLIQLNPSFEPGETLEELVEHDLLHPDA